MPKIYIRPNRSISRVFSLFIVPSSFLVQYNIIMRKADNLDNQRNVSSMKILLPILEFSTKEVEFVTLPGSLINRKIIQSTVTH